MFKFKGIPIAALAMILALASTAASAQAPQSAQATSNLNMRAGPGVIPPFLAVARSGAKRSSPVDQTFAC